MKIIATIKGYGQVGENLFEDFQHSYIFDSSDSIDKMLRVTKTDALSHLNLSEVLEPEVKEK